MKGQQYVVVCCLLLASPSLCVQKNEALSLVETQSSSTRDMGTDEVMMIGMPSPVNIEVHTNFRAASGSYDFHAITLALQGDLGRLRRVQTHAENWNGPISFSVLARNSDEQKELEQYWTTAPDKVKQHVSIHLCVAQEHFENYPINKMRNIAMRNVKTEWVYILDIDEDTFGGDMQKHMKEVELAEHGQQSKAVYVVMAWQWSKPVRKDLPHDREHLQKLRKSGLVDHKSSVARSYTPPDVSFDEWLWMDTAKESRFGDGWEPYYIARASQIIEFDPRFVGFGFNKRIQTLEMAANHFKFIVLPDVFNFADENPALKAKGELEGNLDFFDKAFEEVGQKYGCDKCGRIHCVETCPSIFN